MRGEPAHCQGIKIVRPYGAHDFYSSALSGGRYPSPYISFADETIINAFLSSSRTMSRRRGYTIGFTTQSSIFLFSPLNAPRASIYVAPEFPPYSTQSNMSVNTTTESTV